jgi:hypothetical protein
MDKNDAHKVGFLKWEADVTIGRVTYTFQGYTKKGAVRKAAQYEKENSQNVES